MALLFLLAIMQTGYAQLCSVDAGPDQTLTQISPVFLNAASPIAGTGTWTQLSGPSIVSFVDPSDPSTEVTNTAPGTYIFEWTVSDATCDTNSNTVGVSIVGVDLQLEASASNTSPDIGDVVSFTINLSNLGDVDATGVSVRNLVPVGFGSVTAINNGGTFSFVSRNISWTGLTVPLGTNTVSLTFNATALTPTGTSGEYTHIAQVTAADQFDLDSTPNNDDGDQSEDDEASVTAAPIQADLSLTKSVVGNNLNPYVGSQISFEISVTNSGPDDATNVVVVDQLLSGFSFVSYTATSGTYSSANGFWQVGTLATGTTETLLINVTVNPTGNYTNTSQVIASDAYDPDSTPANGVSSEDDQGDISVVPEEVIDLSLTKTIDKSPPLVSDNVRFTITVANDGPSDATSVEVTDLLPSGYTYVSDNSGGSYDELTGIWAVGTIVNGASQSLSILANVNASGNYVNVAEITGHDQTDVDSTPNNNVLGEDDQDEVIVNPDPIVDISVTKTVDEFIPEVGSEIVFIVTVNNAGPSDATNVVITDVLASGYQFVSANPSVGTYNATNGSWTVGGLANGVSETLDITVEVLPAGVYSNTAELTSVTEDDVDSTPGNNSEAEDDQQTITPVVVPVSDLLLRKSVNVLSPYVGQDVIFTISITNYGPSDATGVEIMDQLPTGYSYVSHSSTAGIYNASTGIWALNGTMADGNTETLNIVATVNPDGDYFNVTEVFASDNLDPNSIPNNNNFFENDQDNAGTTPIPSADLNLDVSVDNTTPDVGTNVTFTLTLLNEGPSDAIGVMVQNRLPSGYTFVSDDSAGSFDPNNGRWNIGNIAAGAQLQLNLVVQVNPSGDYNNIAEVIAAILFDLDSTPNNNMISEDDQDEQTTNPRHVTDISVTKTADNMSPDAGSEIVFTIVAANDGPNDATGLIIEDQLPSGYNFVSATTTSGTYDEIAGSWDLPNLANGASATLEIRAMVLSSGSYVNTAELIALDTYDPDSTPNNNLGSEDDQSTVIPVPQGLSDLSLSKTVDNASPNVGDVVRFVISVTNYGPTNASGVMVTDLLPEGFSYQSHFSTAGVYNPNSGVWNINRTILNQDTESLEVLAVVNAPTGTEGEYVNQAYITASNFMDPDSDPSVGPDEDDFLDGIVDDDEASVSVIPQTTDISITKTVNNMSPSMGNEVVFTITATNQGNLPATIIGIEDQLPSGYEFVSSVASLGTFDNSGIWEITILQPDEIATLDITVKVLDIEDYVNRASLAYVDQWDTDESNNMAEAYVVPTCLVVYNEFSPNGDGVNDYFKIDCIAQYPNNSLQVYNRWGNIVFETRSYKNDWDGTPNGRAIVQKEDQLPVGTYYYVLDLGDGSEPRTDWLYINR
ncbi:gliding motility-associated C-terminal domain-containing protein [Flagellimonas sediminis]|uniref:DUF11 domain-containing protein n=1 Tax=Flagellimonas sediminis TaxID=2696468 RepID=A0A6I5KSB9_9FLAO|nr:gliding motility-associated C-terminal domain-containing protein [Allomuricauda sediminis]NDV42559.1 DUF11 domain-containing protein [Allomuricauda sediminis]